MSIAEIAPPRYVAAAFAISSTFAVAFGSATEALGQVDLSQDLNLQSRVETFSPPLSANRPEIPETNPRTLCLQKDGECHPISRAQATEILAQVMRRAVEKGS